MVKRTFRFHLLSARVKDGDTVQVVLDLGRRLRCETDLRLLHWDAPETHTRRQLEKQAGLVVAAQVDLWLARWVPRGLEVLSSAWEEDKFGRLLGDMQASDAGFAGQPPDPAGDPVGIGTWAGCLIAGRMVQQTSPTGARAPWSDLHLQDIIQAGPPLQPGRFQWHHA